MAMFNSFLYVYQRICHEFWIHYFSSAVIVAHLATWPPESPDLSDLAVGMLCSLEMTEMGAWTARVCCNKSSQAHMDQPNISSSGSNIFTHPDQESKHFTVR